MTMRRFLIALVALLSFAAPLLAEDGYTSPRAWKNVAFTEQVTVTPGPFITGSGSFTPTILGPSGTGCTAGAVPYSFTGDTNTGLSTSAVDTLVLCTAGTANVTLSSAGVLTTGSNIQAGGAVLSANGSSVGATDRTRLSWPADGEFDARNNAGTVNAGLRASYIVEANTGTKNVTALESRELISNSGDADGSIINLPDDPTAGHAQIAAVVAAQTITINTGAGETIWLAGTSCGTDITGSDTGASLLIFAVTGGSGAVWHAIGSGTWTC